MLCCQSFAALWLKCAATITKETEKTQGEEKHFHDQLFMLSESVARGVR